MNWNKIYDSDEFKKKYENDDFLGVKYNKECTNFSLWSPAADLVKIKLYSHGMGGFLIKEQEMIKIRNGVWHTTILGDLDGQYYNYQITINGKTEDITDIHAIAGGVNSFRNQILDLTKTNPPGWENDKRILPDSPIDAIVYEVHIRDISVHNTSGISLKGKFLSLTEKGTKNPRGISTGIDHIKELGITHIQLMPIFDFGSIDDAGNGYNWGYDPVHYNFPKGAYATNPFNGAVKINELKKMIQFLHCEGIGVILDVVYNHTYIIESCFNKTVPGYYYRTDQKGNFTNGSGCGNETNSERYMMRRFIIESLLHWVLEYHIDGFRFDLMGLHDIELMNNIRAELDKIDPGILTYGEGWQGGVTSLKENKAALKSNWKFLDKRIGFFNDHFRDSAKGHVFEKVNRGFLSGNHYWRQHFKDGIMGKIEPANFTKEYKANDPIRSVIYLSCHDNLTLWDKLSMSLRNAYKFSLRPYPIPIHLKRAGMFTLKLKNLNPRFQINKMCAVALLTSQGMPFFLAGEEFCRTKDGDTNSYNSGDKINAIDWLKKSDNLDLFNYYKGLITLRKNHPAFRMRTINEVSKHLNFIPLENSKYLLGYTILNVHNEPWKRIAVVYNTSIHSKMIKLPYSNWVVFVDGERSGITPLKLIKGDTFLIPPITAYVLADYCSLCCIN